MSDTTSTQGRLISDNVRVREFEVGSNFDGWRLDQFLAARISRMSRSLAGRIAKHGNVDVYPPRKIKAGTQLREDDRVILREELEPERIQDHQVEVVYRDQAIIALAKPPGMLVHQSTTTRLNTIQKYLHRRGVDGAEPVHRLDRETSGILLCAATQRWVPTLRGMFATSHPDKIYRALVLDPDHQWQVGDRRTLEAPLGFDPDSQLDIKMGRGELEATTHVQVVGRINYPGVGPLADLRVVIDTGRQHQIRIHLALQGTPIAGDKLYSVDDDFFMAITDDPDNPELLDRLPFDRHALHAWQLRVDHPVSDQPLDFEVELPAIWNAPHAP